MPTHRRIRPTAVRNSRAAVRIVLGLVVASTLLGSGGAVRAQSAPAPTLGGFTGNAAASGLHAQYNPAGLLPTGPPVDLGAPDALATIASGPSTFARAAVADPGDLLANPDALLSAGSPDYPQGSIPPWPLRIEASSGVGRPSAESTPAPGLHARVHAEGGSSSAEATMPAADAPAVVTVGSMAAYADTSTDGTSVTVHARSEMNGIDILGLIQIESVITDLTATSTGADTTFDGGTTVVGATLAGQPAEIDDEGIRARGLDAGALLEPLGIRVTLPGPVALEGANAGQLASTGLRIDIEASQETLPGLGDALDALPPIEPIAPGAPSAEDVIAVARARHLVAVELARGVVSLTARAATPRTTAPTTPSASATPSAPLASPVARPSAPSFAPTPAPAAPAPAAAAPVLANEVPAASVGTGVGALAALLLLLQPFIGDRLARVAVAQLATDQEGCSWERR